jgi:Cdc6-like AAA superfamily ATPase
MAKKKIGILGYFVLFIKFIFGIVKWIAVSAFNLIKFIILGLASLRKKGNETRKDIKSEGKRPKMEATYEGFIELETLQGKMEKFESKIYSSKSLIGLIFGSRGSGKSVIGMRILENVHSKTKRKVYTIGFNKEDLPKWITPINSIEEIKPNAFVLVDEGGVEFSSRDSMSKTNKMLSQLLLISRHKDLSVLFISQNSSNIEINAIRQADYLILKSPSLLQLDFERKKIKEIYAEIKDKFDKYKENKGASYIYSDEYLGFASNDLPSFWSEKVSKSYRDKGQQKSPSK